eukprot:scaffold122043_cov44-Attheya_sp.AAC.2
MVSAAGGCCGGENRFSVRSIVNDCFLSDSIFAPVYVLYCILHRWKHNPVSRQNGGRAPAHAPVAVFLTGTSWEWHNTMLAIYVDG